MSDDRLFDMDPSDGRPKWLRLQEEAAKRDAAVEQVEKNADEEWKEKALVVIETLATYRPRFTTDDLWELIERPREPRAAGALMTKAHRAGWIRPLEEWQTLGSHRRPIRVWESRLYRGQS